MMPTPAARRLDVRSIAPEQRHATIFSSFDELGHDQWMELVNDHDPQPLQRQFEAERLGQFEWAYLERGPERWRVQLRRLSPAAVAAAADDSCCSGGACC